MTTVSPVSLVRRVFAATPAFPVGLAWTADPVQRASRVTKGLLACQVDKAAREAAATLGYQAGREAKEPRASQV